LFFFGEFLQSNDKKNGLANLTKGFSNFFFKKLPYLNQKN
jgi:hypothetical protein